MIQLILSLLVTGILFGSGPCLASCGPVLISYIAGTKKNFFEGLQVYIIFSLSRIFVYVILSLLIFFLGKIALEHILGQYSKYILIAGGAFISLVGLLMAFGKKLEFSHKGFFACCAGKYLTFLQRIILEHDKKSIILFGLVIGLLPCAPLLVMLSYIGLISKSWPSSLLFSVSFGIGTLVSPLLLLSMFAGFIPKLLNGKQAFFSRIFTTLCGLVIVFLGVQLVIRAF